MSQSFQKGGIRLSSAHEPRLENLTYCSHCMLFHSEERYLELKGKCCSCGRFIFKPEPTDVSRHICNATGCNRNMLIFGQNMRQGGF